MRDCTDAVPFRLLFSLASCRLHACFRSTNHLKYHESFFLVQNPLLLLISQPVYHTHHRIKLRHQVHRLHSSSSFYLYSPSQKSSFFLSRLSRLSHLKPRLQCNEFASSGAGRSFALDRKHNDTNATSFALEPFGVG